MFLSMKPAYETCHCLNFNLRIKLDGMFSMSMLGKGQMCWGRAESIVTVKEAHNAHTPPPTPPSLQLREKNFRGIEVNNIEK
jgi:hypothetical protein